MFRTLLIHHQEVHLVQQQLMYPVMKDQEGPQHVGVYTFKNRNVIVNHKTALRS